MARRFFLDTEFSEEPGRLELLSIGIVGEGQELYAINRDADWSRCNDWVRKNVLPQLRRDWAKYAITLPQIRAEILEMIPAKVKGQPYEKPSFWTYFGAYDWVAFCWIFGRMVDLPPGYPMFANDLKQWADQLGGVKLPKQEQDEHWALADARWNRDSYQVLADYEHERKKMMVMGSSHTGVNYENRTH